MRQKSNHHQNKRNSLPFDLNSTTKIDSNFLRNESISPKGHTNIKFLDGKSEAPHQGNFKMDKLILPG